MRKFCQVLQLKSLDHRSLSCSFCLWTPRGESASLIHQNIHLMGVPVCISVSGDSWKHCCQATLLRNYCQQISHRNVQKRMPGDPWWLSSGPNWYHWLFPGIHLEEVDTVPEDQVTAGDLPPQPHDHNAVSMRADGVTLGGFGGGCTVNRRHTWGRQDTDSHCGERKGDTDAKVVV